MVIAFDFDKTIADERLHRFAKKMKREGNEIWIVTMRSDSYFNRSVLNPTLGKLGLTEHNVIFCDEKPKEEILQMINADIYIDNISDEFESISGHTNTIPLLWLNL